MAGTRVPAAYVSSVAFEKEWLVMAGRIRWNRLVVAGLALVLLATACGGGDAASTTTSDGETTLPDVTTTSPSTSAAVSTTEAPETTPAPTTVPSTTGPSTTGGPTSTPATVPATTVLPGEPIEIGPRAGDTLAVVGVAFDDSLNLRAAPGVGQEILAKLDPLEDGLKALGNARRLPNSIWYEVEHAGTDGWVSSSFVAYLGATDDVTALLISQLGTTPQAETMLDLGLIVAEAVASEEPPSRIVVSVAPSVGDLGEITYDVVGLGDDALFGVRLHVFGTPDAGGEGFTLKSVEQTSLCGRGVSDGLCV
jgi:hypothetical protein